MPPRRLMPHEIEHARQGYVRRRLVRVVAGELLVERIVVDNLYERFRCEGVEREPLHPMSAARARHEDRRDV